MRGSKKAASVIGIEHCSALDWTLFAVFVAAMLGTVVFVVRLMDKQERQKEEAGYKRSPGDITFNLQNSIKFCIIGLIGGLCAGGLGIGGGMIFNPLLLGLGSLPQVASATGMYLVIFSSMATTTQFALSGELDWNYAVVQGAFVIVGSCIGLCVMNSVVKKTGKQSPVVIILAFLIAAAAIVMPLFGVINMVEDYNKGVAITSF